MRMIVVEDESRTRKGIISLVKKYCPGCSIVGEAENGAKGLELITDLLPDLIIVDIRMPEMDGLQMLQYLQEKGVKPKTIILSGHSEFEYAQKAIGFGVSDYLLKPIMMEHLIKAVKKIQDEISSEKAAYAHAGQDPAVTSAEMILFNFILGKLDHAADLKKHLQEIHQIEPDHSFGLFLGHLGKQGAGNVREQVFQTVQGCLALIGPPKHFLIDLDVYQELIILVPGGENFIAVERQFQIKIIPQIQQQGFKDTVFGSIQVDGLERVKTGLQLLRKELKWSIVLGEEVLIACHETRQIQTKAVRASAGVSGIHYPLEIENAIKAAVYAADTSRIRQLAEEFLAWWQKEPVQPESVIDAFIRFTTALLNVLKDTNLELYTRLNQKYVLQQMFDAQTRFEIKSLLGEVIEEICAGSAGDARTRERIYSLLIKKVLDIIAEHYNEELSLYKIAMRFHVTPEYLGVLFTKEVGANFSSYIKEIRINKAKALLLTTNLKTYEIAMTVGYPDPKYFCRIFKEVVGASPSEFVKVNS